MSKSQDPCKVCGGRDLTLVDGFYYCVECGTQDVNVQETVVEHTVLADGTFAHAATRKFTTVLKDAIEMSGEWHKWHAFNFILSSLSDELIALGAPPTFKNKVLWIWTRYMNQFTDKELMGKTVNELENKDEVISKSMLFKDFFEEEVEVTDKGKKKSGINAQTTSKASKKVIGHTKVDIVTKGLLLAILYIALNLEKCDIQLSHLFRFIRERRLSLPSCTKFVPKELNLKSFSNWKNFIMCQKDYTPKFISKMAASVFKTLNLGIPIAPNPRHLVDNYIKELCLPEQFKNLVFSLMLHAPCDYLQVNYEFFKKGLVRIPDFEGVVMSYILVALKMTFGLDDHYEVDLSDAVDKINEEEDLPRAHKFGNHSNPTDRLFSFREWIKFLEFRKTMLCKYYLPMAQEHNADVDDYVFMEQLGERKKVKVDLSDEVTMDILNKIPVTEQCSAIPVSEFEPTLTPLFSYSQVVLQYVQDPEIKLLLSEDFTQYSLKYACEKLKLPNEDAVYLRGVTEEHKTINKSIGFDIIKADKEEVFVKICENKNWLKTNRPKAEHITFVTDKTNNSLNERNSDNDSDSGLENTPESDGSETVSDHQDPTSNETIQEKDKEGESEKVLETIEEEAADNCIFDDSFDDIYAEKKQTLLSPEADRIDSDNDNMRIIECENNFPEAEFDPKTFDRDRTIKELILHACKKYRIPIPREYDERDSRKRRHNFINDETGESSAKKRQVVNVTKPGEARKELNRLMTTYYMSLGRDVLNQASKQLQNVSNINETLNNNDDIYLANCNESFVHNESQLDLDDEEKKSKSLLLSDSGDNVEPSVMQVNDVEESNPENWLPKTDPKFDEKTHDIKQLYLKCSGKLNIDDVLKPLEVDTEIEKILAKKIEEFSKDDPETIFEKYFRFQKDLSDSEDDEALIFLAKKIQSERRRKKKEYENLIKHKGEIKEFKYWMRHYSSATMRKTGDVKQKFDLEVKANLPKSFAFVLNQCADIVCCSAFNLYKHMQDLEKFLFINVLRKRKSHRRRTL